MLTHCLTYPVGSRHKHVVSALTEVRMKGNRLWMHVQLEQGNVHHSYNYAKYIQLHVPMDSSIITKECNQGLMKSPKTLSVDTPLDSFIECKIEEMNNLVLPLTVDLQLPTVSYSSTYTTAAHNRQHTVPNPTYVATSHLHLPVKVDTIVVLGGKQPHYGDLKMELEFLRLPNLLVFSCKQNTVKIDLPLYLSIIRAAGQELTLVIQRDLVDLTRVLEIQCNLVYSHILICTFMYRHIEPMVSMAFIMLCGGQY